MRARIDRMSYVNRFRLMLAMWVVFLVVYVSLIISHIEWWWMVPLAGFSGYIWCFSFSWWLFTGKWPQWDRVWRMFRSGGKDNG